MVGFMVLAYFEKDNTNKAWQIAWICSAILINPVVKVALGRTLWNVVDVIWAILLIVKLMDDYKKVGTTRTPDN